MPKIVPFANLDDADLVVDAIYEGGEAKHAGSDPLQKLLRVGNSGGFRMLGSARQGNVHLCVLFSRLANIDWPDRLSPETGVFRYYGDNKTPGSKLHSTPRLGNLFLRDTFARLHSGRRDLIPPILIFTKGPKGRDVVFRGLAIPGTGGGVQQEDLVAIWRTSKGERFQNYRALFSILDVPTVSRQWLKSCLEKTPNDSEAPRAWLRWRDSGKHDPLIAPRTTEVRTPEQQLPKAPSKLKLLTELVTYFKHHPQREYAFERAAGAIFEMLDANIQTMDYTRPWRDGGRDALGKYRIGSEQTKVEVEFALEAKCKKPSTTNSSGVPDVSRLISRLRHRQFGVFVTTSCVSKQAYSEVVEDGHPVLFLCGIDIIDILADSGISSSTTLGKWLQAEFAYPL